MSISRRKATIALTSTVALLGSALVASPAAAAGLADNSFVSLVPTSGKSYNVLAIAGDDFSLSSNQASSITASGKNLKFLVEDPNEVVSPAFGTTGETLTPKADDGLTVAIDVDTEIITLTDSDLQGAVSAGQFIYFTADLKADDGGDDTPATIASKETALEVLTSAGNDITFKSDLNLTDDSLDGLDVDGAVPDVVIISEARDATTKSFVVDSALATNVSDKVLVLNNDASTATVSVDVTAWVDDNSNGKIDSTEYASPKRTVSWVKPSTVTPTVAWSPVVVGDETATATVNLSPTINFDQQDKADFEVDIQRQGSSATLGSDDGSNVAESWSTADQEWTITSTLAEVAGDLTSEKWDVLTKAPALASFDKTATTDAAVDITHYAQSGTTATLYTDASHGLSVNDTITVSNFLASATGAKVTAVTDTTFSYTTTAASATTAKTAVGGNNPVAALVKYFFATAGEYKATVKLGSTPAKIGTTSVISAGTQVSAGVKNVATLTDAVSAGFKVRAGTTAAVQVTSTVTNSDKKAVPAGTPVSIAVTETSTGVVTVNGTTVTTSKTINATTDANGQVVISVTNSSGANGETVQLAVSSQGFSDTDTLTWETAAYALTDLADNDTTGVAHRSALSGGEVAFQLVLRDQWGQAPSGDFRLKVVGAGTRYVSTTYEAMSNGALNYTWTDTPVDASDTTGTVTFTVQQKNSAGSWVSPTGDPLVALKADGAGELDQDSITINIRSTAGTSVALNADGVSSADLSASAATVALKAADTRTPGVSANDVSTETNDVTAAITGTIKDAFTGVAQPGSAVTISGSSAILFENGAEAAYGSLTVIASSTGTFSVNAYSNSSLTDSVVTVAANGASSTVKVSFVGAGADVGTAWEITAPTSAVPGSTFQVTAKLVDAFGNGVEVSTSGDVKAVYTGPGLIVGTLPKITDKDGELTFSVLLGSSDSGTATMTFSYDQNSDDDFVDAKDVVATQSITVGTATASSDTKVNAGSFKGYVAVYAKGYEGKRLSAKIGNDWIIVPALASNFERVVDFTGAGVSIAVRIYIDRVLIDTINLVTK